MNGMISDLLEWLEERNVAVFMFAGVLFAGVAFYKGAGDFTSWSVTMEVDTIVGGLALMTPAFGLLGLYPRLREAAPRLSVAGTVSATVSATVVLVVLVWFFATTFQLGRFPVWDEAPVWTAVALAVVFITLALGFLAFGVAGLRTMALPQRVSLLLLIPAVLWLGLLVNVGVRAIPNMDFYAYVVDTLAVLAIAYLLQTEAELTNQTDPTVDTTG